jgi:hypothetical protein
LHEQDRKTTVSSPLLKACPSSDRSEKTAVTALFKAVGSRHILEGSAFMISPSELFFECNADQLPAANSNAHQTVKLFLNYPMKSNSLTSAESL